MNKHEAIEIGVVVAIGAGLFWLLHSGSSGASVSPAPLASDGSQPVDASTGPPSSMNYNYPAGSANGWGAPDVAQTPQEMYLGGVNNQFGGSNFAIGSGGSGSCGCCAATPVSGDAYSSPLQAATAIGNALPGYKSPSPYVSNAQWSNYLNQFAGTGATPFEG